jgi:hypothetical protein
VMLATTWSAVSYYEHVWTPQWRTSVYGGLLGTNWGSEAVAEVCTMPAGFGPVGFSAGTNSMFSNQNSAQFPTNQPTGTAVVNNYKGAVSNCDPNSSWWQLGTRTMWNPVPDIDIGFDLSWVHLNTAFAGTAVLNGLGTVFQPNAIGRTSGLYNIDNQDVYSVMFRIQRNFLY